MQGWVVVYVPGSVVYQAAVGEPGAHRKSLAKRVLRRSVKTLLTCAQIYWWIKS